MEIGKDYCSLEPHPDIENHMPREPIPYFIELPEAGIDEDTGLIFTISGYGFSPEHKYEAKLRHHLANQYNCIVVGVDYFGCAVKFMFPKDLRLSENFFEKFRDLYKVNIEREEGVSLEQTITQLAGYLLSQGITAFDQSLYLYTSREGTYQSFGLLPALDYLQVLAELLQKYKLNKKRLYILGSSYGGYIGLLLGKLAPNTFRLIVDNSGFVEAKLSDMLGVQNGLGVWRNVNGCAVPIGEWSIWSVYPSSEHYLDKHHREIRSLLLAEHIYPSATEYYNYHSVEDTLIPQADKAIFKTLRPDMDIQMDFVTEERIDGDLFKTLEHGLGASLRGVFELSYQDHLRKNRPQDESTDFDLESHYTFPCSNGFTYNIRFSSDDVQLELSES